MLIDRANLPYNLYSCQKDSDCTVVYGDITQGTIYDAHSINVKYADWYNNEMKKIKEKTDKTLCKPSLSQEAFCEHNICDNRPLKNY
ncbi:MAG: hypothetical protein U5L76_05450 [Patescibacteria group bacterium]|nr:hypothetical protein [Patescibacteria group bacterium]